MQRLFSSFPDGKPGLALLLMRLALAVMLLDGVADWARALGSVFYVAVPGFVSMALCGGFLTPVMCVLVLFIEAAVAVISQGDINAVHVCAVLNAVALSILSPGAYSVDAKLYGHRRLVIREGRLGRGSRTKP